MTQPKPAKKIDTAILRAVRDGIDIGELSVMGNKELANKKAAKYGLTRYGVRLK